MARVAGLIYIPNSAAIRSCRTFMAEADWSLQHDVTVIRFHPKWCHMQPWVVAALAAWGLAAQREGVEVRVENPERARYAWRLGLAQYLGIEPGLSLQEHEQSGRFVTLRTIRHREDLGALMPDVVPLLHLDKEPEQARAVQYVLSEMIRNVLEHSDSVDGAVVCAQYYTGEASRKGAPTRRYVSVGIADTGRGVQASLLHNYPGLVDDEDALLHAIQPGVTGAVPGLYGTSNNAGAGLFFTRRLAESSDGYFAIGSGDAMYRSSTAIKRPADSKLTFPIGGFPGTIINVDFSLEDDVQFDEFLRMTGEGFSRLDARTRAKVDSRINFT